MSKTNLKTPLGDCLRHRFAISIIVVATICVSAVGRTIYVDDDGPSEYSRIQDAIDVAVDGDTIVVKDGTYRGEGNHDIDFKGKAITVRSQNGPQTCIIDCKGNCEELHRGFSFHSGEDTESTLNGFTVTNGFSYFGGGVYCYSTNPTITNCIIINNIAIATPDGYPGYGSGIYLWGSAPVINKCIIAGNSTYVCGREYEVPHSSFYGCGGGMAILGNSNPSIMNCEFECNTAGFSGGGIYADNSKITISSCRFTENSTSIPLLYMYGGEEFIACGGIYIINSQLMMTNSNFVNNSSNMYGYSVGGITNVSTRATIEGCTFSGNTAYADSFHYSDALGVGAMCNIRSNTTVTSCIFSENSLLGGGENCTFAAGGMFNITSSLMITKCTFSGNLGSINWGPSVCGGGMGNYRSNPVLTNCVFQENCATIGYGGSASGGMCNVESTPKITDCTFSQNSSSVMYPWADESFGGGAILNLNSNLTITRCTFNQNSASTDGFISRSSGGIFSAESSQIIDNCIFRRNSASPYSGSLIEAGGGILSLNGSLMIKNTRFIANSGCPMYCSFGGAGACGAIYSGDWDTRIVNCTFEQNWGVANGTGAPGSPAAWAAGGLISANANVNNCLFIGNSGYADSIGGGSAAGGIMSSSGIVTNCILWGNSPCEAKDSVVVIYSDIKGGWTEGEGNINIDPQFMPDGYHLTSNSPCINAGDPTGNYSGQKDIDGQARVIGGRVDIGADEFSAKGPPTVTNITARQQDDESKLVDIYYKLSDPDGDRCFVSVKVSNDGGSTWNVAASHFTGDIESGISPGSDKDIVWDCSVDLPNAYGTNYKIAVTATDGLGSNTEHSNIFTIDNRKPGEIRVKQRAKGIFLSGISFNNTFHAEVDDWQSGSPGKVTFTLNGQSDTVPYVPTGAETSFFDMGNLPAAACAVTSYLRITAKNNTGTLVAEATVPLQCIQRPWFIPSGVYVKSLSPLQWDQDIIYGASQTFHNFNAITSEGANILFSSYGGQFSGGAFDIEFNGAKGEYAIKIMGDVSTEPKPGWDSLWYPMPDAENISTKGHSTLSAGMSAKARINMSTGCFEGGPEVCARGKFGYEWKMTPIGPLFGIPALWFTGKVGFDVTPEMCFDIMAFSMENPLPLTTADINLHLMGQGGLELGIPYFLSVFGGIEGNARGKIHVLGDPVETCSGLPMLADLNFDISIVGYARFIFTEWPLGRYMIVQWSCEKPGAKGLILIPVEYGGPIARKAGRPYLKNGEPYSRFAPGVSSLKSQIRTLSTSGETDEPVIENVNLEATPALAGLGNLVFLATSEDDPIAQRETPEHEIQAVFRIGNVWSNKEQITHNDVPDVLPTAAFDVSNKPIVAWTTIPNVTDDDDITKIKPKMEIAYSTFNDKIQSWSNPIQLTTDGTYLDALPQLANGADGSTNLVWIRSNDNSLPVGPNEPLGSPSQIMVSRWNGSSFSTPQVLFALCDTAGPVRYTRDNSGREFLLWTRDANGDPNTINDKEVVESHTVGGVWTSPQALTSNLTPDIAAVLLCSGSNVIAYYISLQTGGTPDRPADQLIARVFDGSSWSNGSVQFTAPAILSPSFAISSGNAISCVFIGASLNSSGKAILYATSPTGVGNWAQPQEMATQSSPSSPSSAYAGENLQVAYVSARPSAKSAMATLSFDTQKEENVAFDVRFLDHPPYADLWLQATDIAVNPQTPIAGEPVTVSVAVHLAGDYSQQDVNVAVYDGDPCSGGILIDSNSTDLMPGGSATLEFTWVYPTDSESHKIYCVVDANDVIAELNENNNKAYAPVGIINLEAVSVNYAFGENDLVGIAVSLRNTGIADLNDVAFELKRDSEVGPVILSDTVSIVPAGKTVEVIVPWDVTLTSPGVYNVFLLLDPYGKVSEENEFDNQSQGVVTVLPDLKIEDPNINDQNETAELVVRNIGAKPSLLTTVRVVFNEQVLDEVAVESLGPRESSDILMSIAGCATSMPITFTVNPDSNGLDEVTLQNNTVAGIIYSPADFEPDGDVDYTDLAELAGYWLQNEPSVDIIPQPTGDGIVNFKDIALLAEHWLEGAPP